MPRTRLSFASNIEDLRSLARSRLPTMVFDYIDGAAGEGQTARRNRESLAALELSQHALVDVSVRSTRTTLFGRDMAAPIVVGPTGLNGAFWPDGDLALARAARAGGLPIVMSTAATAPLDAFAQAAGPLKWFQLYMLKDRGLAGALLDRVWEQGFEVLELTVDTAVAGRRNRDIRNGFTLPFRWHPRALLGAACHPAWAAGMLRTPPTLRLFQEFAGRPPAGSTISAVMQGQLSSTFSWTDLDWLRARWPGHLVLKGILEPQDAIAARQAGVNGIVVSNHGGRQLDGARPSIVALPPILEAVGGVMTVLVDSGFRSGMDIAKALALGASAVQLGRATLYGLAAQGQAGAARALDILIDELDRTMALTGARSPQELRGRCRPGPSTRGFTPLLLHRNKKDLHSGFGTL